MDWMKILEVLLLSTLMTVMGASSALALVTVSTTTTQVAPLSIGDTFDVDILLSWDGTARVA